MCNVLQTARSAVPHGACTTYELIIANSSTFWYSTERWSTGFILKRKALVSSLLHAHFRSWCHEGLSDTWISKRYRKSDATPCMSWKTFNFKCVSRSRHMIQLVEKVYFRSQILEHPSITEYWNIFGVPVLPENVIFTFFRTCWCYSEAYNTGMQKWSSIVQYSCTSIWDLKYTFSQLVIWKCWSSPLCVEKMRSVQV